MADINVTKSGSGVGAIGGFNRDRYERQEIAYGVIPANSYAANDVLKFTELPALKVIRAEFRTVETTPKVLQVGPAETFSAPVEFDLEGVSPAIEYVIEYVRGSGVNVSVAITDSTSS